MAAWSWRFGETQRCRRGDVLRPHSLSNQPSSAAPVCPCGFDLKYETLAQYEVRRSVVCWPSSTHLDCKGIPEWSGFERPLGLGEHRLGFLRINHKRHGFGSKRDAVVA